jgi:hypothetical protein
MNDHFLRADMVEELGQEQANLAEKTWPLVIPEHMRLAAIVSNGAPGIYEIRAAFDITEPERYEQLIEMVRNGIWARIRLFFLSDLYLAKCRIRYAT